MNVIQHRASPSRRTTRRRLLGVMLILTGAVMATSSLVVTATPSTVAAISVPLSSPFPGVGVQAAAVPFAVGSVMSVGVAHTCATDSTGALFCWGNNTAGQLGDGTSTAASKPVAVLKGEMPDTKVSAVAAGEVQTCAVHTGEVYCWGQNARLQLGFNGLQQLTAKKVPKVTNGFQNTGVTALTAAFGTTCAIASGKLFCWGDDDSKSGKLGDLDGSDVPSAIPSGGGFLNTSVSAASMGLYSACAIESGVVYCWGANVATPAAIPNVTNGFSNTNVTAVSVGAANVCVVKGGAVFCWGDGSNGILGQGIQSSTEAVALPTPLNSGVTSVQLGDRHACALKTGEVYCWGYDINGTLGIGGDRSSAPGIKTITKVADVAGGFANSEVTSLSIGKSAHSCAVYPVSGSAELACWGMGGFGRLGNGNTETAMKPVIVCTTCVDPNAPNPDNPSNPNNPSGPNQPSYPGTPVAGVSATATLTNDGLRVAFGGLPNLGFSEGRILVIPVGATDSAYAGWGLNGLLVSEGVLIHTSRCLIKPTGNNQPPITEAFAVGGNYEVRSFTVQGNGSPRDSNYQNGWHAVGGPIAVTIDPRFTGIAGPCFGANPSGGSNEVVPPVVDNAPVPAGVGESNLVTEQRQEQLTSSAGGAKVLVGGQLVEVSLTQASSTLRSSSPSQRTPEQVAELQNLAVSMLGQVSTALGGNTGSLSVRNTPTGAVIIGLANDPITGAPIEIPIENVVLVTGGGLVLVASGISGRSVARIALDGSIEIPQGGQIAVVAGGLAPGVDGEVVVMSTPRLISDFKVGTSGDISEQATLPADLEVGAHTVVVTVGDDAASLGFRMVADDALPTLPSTGGSNDLIAVWSLVFLVGGALVVALDRRRHLFVR